MVNIYNIHNPVMTARECATRRISVCPSTWETVHLLRKPGQTYDDVIHGAGPAAVVRATGRERITECQW